MKDDEITILWLGAFRYYLGRMTYAVSDFCELLITEWSNFPDSLKQLIQRELNGAFAIDDVQRAQEQEDGEFRHYKQLGHDCDREAWEKVRRLWNENIMLKRQGADKAVGGAAANVKITGGQRPAQEVEMDETTPAVARPVDLRVRGFAAPFETEPDFVNELGVKWWRDDSTTHYAHKPDIHGTTLDAVCFYIEEPSGRRTRVLISKAGEIIEEEQSLEALAVKIDVRKFLKRDHDAGSEAEGCTGKSGDEEMMAPN